MTVLQALSQLYPHDFARQDQSKAVKDACQFGNFLPVTQPTVRHVDLYEMAKAVGG